MGENGSGSEAKGNSLAHGNYCRLDHPAPHCIPTFYVPICKMGTITLFSNRDAALPHPSGARSKALESQSRKPKFQSTQGSSAGSGLELRALEM